MKIGQILQEVFNSVYPEDELLAMYKKPWKTHTLDDADRAVELSKQIGRGVRLYVTSMRTQTVGKIADFIVSTANQNAKEQGNLRPFSPNVTTLKAFSEQVALHTDGFAKYEPSGVSHSGRTGRTFKDPEYFIYYDDKESFEDAFDWVKERAKQIHYYDSMEHLHTAYQIGKFILEPATNQRYRVDHTGNYRLAVTTAALITKSKVRKVADITDQQAAALTDLAATRNQNAYSELVSILQQAQGKEELRRIIDNSKKITARDKQKLDAIIDAAVKGTEL